MKKLLLLLSLIHLSFANVFVVFSYHPTGYPNEKKIGRLYLLDQFDDYHRALVLAEEVKVRTKREVFIGNFKSEEDFKGWLREKNESYLASCIETAIKKDLSYPNFNQALFKEDLREVLKDLKAKGREECDFNTLTELAEVLESFSDYKVKFIVENLRKYLHATGQ